MCDPEALCAAVYTHTKNVLYSRHSLVLGAGCIVHRRGVEGWEAPGIDAAGSTAVAHDFLLLGQDVFPSDFILLLLIMRAFPLLFVVRALGGRRRCFGGRLRLREDLGFLGFTQWDWLMVPGKWG